MLSFLLKIYCFWFGWLFFLTEPNIIWHRCFFKSYYFLPTLVLQYLQQLKPVEVYACFFHIFYSRVVSSRVMSESFSENDDDADDNTNMKVSERIEGAALWEVVTLAATFIL